MHRVALRPEIVERVVARRGRLHLYDARGIVPEINRLGAELRRRGVPVIWVLHQNEAGGADWHGFFEVFVRPENRVRAAQALASGNELQRLWPELHTDAADLRVTKNRYSAFIGAGSLKQALDERGIDTLLIAGTKTNVCCECTARDARERHPAVRRRIERG